MFVFLVLSILYPNGTLAGFAKATKTCPAAKWYWRPLNSKRMEAGASIMPGFCVEPIGACEEKWAATTTSTTTPEIYFTIPKLFTGTTVAILLCSWYRLYLSLEP